MNTQHPSPGGPRPGPASAAQPLDYEVVDRALASLADHDITEHAGIYEQLLSSLQAELNRTEHGA